MLVLVFIKENSHGLSSCCYACLLVYGNINLWICKYVILFGDLGWLVIGPLLWCMFNKKNERNFFFFFFDFLIGVTRKQGFCLTNDLNLFILLRLWSCWNWQLYLYKASKYWRKLLLFLTKLCYEACLGQDEFSD